MADSLLAARCECQDTQAENSQCAAIALKCDVWHRSGTECDTQANQKSPAMSVQDTRRAAMQRFIDAHGGKVLPIAKAIGVSEGTLRNFLTGDTKALSPLTYKKLSMAYGVPVWKLMGEGGVKMVGYVGAGAVVELVEAESDDAPLEMVDCPPDVEPETVVAVRVRGDSMLPMIRPNWLLYYRRDQDGVPEDCIGQLCVIETQDGRMYVKIVQRGYQPGRFNLLNATGSFMQDVPLRWAAKVIWIRP